MKNISIAFCAPSLIIPLNYHHQVQSLLYHLLQVGGINTELHDTGASYGARQYKLFTFSSLRGNKKISKDQICFDRLIYLDVRSIREDFCNSLLKALSMNVDLQLFGNPLKIHSVKWREPMLESSDLKVKMLSPLTVHKTEDGKTYYYTPLDKDFADAIARNFIRKYTAFTGETPTTGIKISPARVGARDKYVTTFKGTLITGWRGEYTLLGSAEHLNFLYYCGLGARNSNGFGMFEPIQ